MVTRLTLEGGLGGGDVITHTQTLAVNCRHKTNSRGRLVGEGDVHPAAGSPKERFRLYGEALERSEHSCINELSE